MHFVYIDDTGDEQVYGYAAVAIPASRFRPILLQVKDFRRELLRSDGIFMGAEFHAWKFVSGRGRIAKQVVTKYRKSQIFSEALEFVAALPGARLFTSFGTRSNRLKTLERMLNRINRAMQGWDSQAVLIFDEGEEKAYTGLVRKLGVYNPIPSKFGRWPDGSEYKNLPTEFIIEDPSFRRSKQSYFIQLADFCGYALLQKERPTPSRMKYGIHEMFPLLESVCVKDANRADPFGTIR